MDHFQIIEATDFKLQTKVYHIKKKRSIQELQLYSISLSSYCPFKFFTIDFCPGHNFQSIKASNFKLYTKINHITKNAVCKNHNSIPSIFRVIALCKCNDFSSS